MWWPIPGSTPGHLGVGLAEAALEPLAAVSECHEGAHVGLAPQAAHGTQVNWGVEVMEEQMIVIIYQLTGQNNKEVKRPIKPQLHWTIR